MRRREIKSSPCAVRESRVGQVRSFVVARALKSAPIKSTENFFAAPFFGRWRWDSYMYTRKAHHPSFIFSLHFFFFLHFCHTLLAWPFVCECVCNNNNKSWMFWLKYKNKELFSRRSLLLLLLKNIKFCLLQAAVTASNNKTCLEIRINMRIVIHEGSKPSCLPRTLRPGRNPIGKLWR